MKRAVIRPWFATGLVAALVSAAFTTTAFAICKLTDGPPGLFEDVELSRYESLWQSRAKGLASALASRDAAGRDYVSRLLATPERQQGTPSVSDLEGNYKCRVAKLGGLIGVIVYAPFNCSITAEDGTARLVKTSGSQRLSGHLVPFGEGFTYYGALHYHYEQPKNFGDEADRNQVGCLVALDDGRLRLDLPQPHFDSDHDILVFDPVSQ